MYAGSDFILMPSRVEPCGLNQMFTMRYGTIPIVRSVGGLLDKVWDIYEGNGFGIRFDEFALNEAEHAISRAIDLLNNKKELQQVVSRIVKLDYSWKSSAKEYINMYNELLTLKKRHNKRLCYCNHSWRKKRKPIISSNGTSL